MPGATFQRRAGGGGLVGKGLLAGLERGDYVCEWDKILLGMAPGMVVTGI